MVIMSSIDRLLRAIKSPQLFARGFNRLYHRRAGLHSENTAGVDVFDEDWNTLVVLDACRYDMFELTSQIEGSLSSRISKGSSTVEWLQANFGGRDLRDTVYVTANPQLEENRDQWDIQLHEIINVWLDEGWDEEAGTVRAETMTEAALEAIEQFPNKRLVIHYMQPHYPFVPAETEFDKNHLHQMDGKGGSPSEENVWNQKFKGELDLSRERLWSIYTDNLKYVLEEIEKLFIGNFGKIVITGDHGNYVGERASPIPIKEWGHPRGMYDEPVIRVPWLEINTGDRRQVTSDVTDNSAQKVQNDVVAERLRDLGYKK